MLKVLMPKTREEWQAEWRAQNDLRAAYEKIFTKELTQEFITTGQEAANAYIDHGQGAEAQAIKAHALRLQVILRKLYNATGRAFAERARTQLQKSLLQNIEVKTEWTEAELINRMALFSNKWSASKVTQITATTERRINSAITLAQFDPDATTQSIADDIEATTGGLIGPYRALLISTTETHSAANEGNFLGAQSLGLNLQKFWIATNDERTREDHADVDTDPINMEDTFDVGEDQLMYPGDPSGSAEEIINCRCVLGYAEATP